MTKRQACIAYAKQRGMNVAGNQGNGICVSGADTGAPADNWVTVFETWQEFERFLVLVRDGMDCIAALEMVNAA